MFSWTKFSAVMRCFTLMALLFFCLTAAMPACAGYRELGQLPGPGLFLVVEDGTDSGAVLLKETLSAMLMKLEVWDVSVQGPVDGQKVFDHLGGAVIRYTGNAGPDFKWDDDELYLYSEFMGSRGNFMLVGRNFPQSFYSNEVFVDNLFANIAGQEPIGDLVAPVSKVFQEQASFSALQKDLLCDVYKNVDPGEALLTIGSSGKVVGVFGET
ncbi:MAG: hypothetical protein CVV64_12415 [Candidatus Wallbacteria bacterium HGW-Wallbacteria-1]|uniref:Uncharacterized protein n=1 Tax=Candidatus Wallbacteria bacterium HGW-Wallbacteria-1 TaxID=2013854 RepID=A0A2N1PN94_9BACT|nr:MAG: hypothetical protein CVV64_12415 [Candidatus Wallbacteria bacterium HGW-Wallbacteria-1]